MKEISKEYMRQLLLHTRKMLLEEIEILERGTVEGFKRYNEIDDELAKIRNSLVDLKLQ